MVSSDFDWLTLKVLESTSRPLSDQDRRLVFNRLEVLSEKKLLSLVNRVQKLATNPSSLGAFLKNSEGLQDPTFLRKKKPRRVQRKRGYDDKGTLADQNFKIVKQIQRESYLSILALEDNYPMLIRIFRSQLSRYLSERGDYISIRRIREFLTDSSEFQEYLHYSEESERLRTEAEQFLTDSEDLAYQGNL